MYHNANSDCTIIKCAFWLYDTELSFSNKAKGAEKRLLLPKLFYFAVVPWVQTIVVSEITLCRMTFLPLPFLSPQLPLIWKPHPALLPRTPFTLRTGATKHQYQDRVRTKKNFDFSRCRSKKTSSRILQYRPRCQPSVTCPGPHS